MDQKQNRERAPLLNSEGPQNSVLTNVEPQVSFFENVKLYFPAIFWSLFFGLGVIMVGFDNHVLGQLYATPAFRRDFGYQHGDDFILPARWMSLLSLGNPTGQVFGALLAAHPMELYGRKKTFATCVLLTAGCVFIQFSAKSLHVLLIGEAIGGLVLGTYIVIAPSYAAEVCPLALRGVLTSCTNIFFVIGQLLSSCTIAMTSRLDTHWAYSLPFAMQWVWPCIILIGLPFAPESPWWLQRQDRLEEAEQSLKRLSTARVVDVKPILAQIIETDRLERKLEAGTSYWDCFSGVNLRRTEIASGVYCLQIFSGIYLAGYVAYFFELANLHTDQAFELSIGFLVLGFVGTCFSWVLLAYFGRRSVYLTGLAVLALLQFVIAVLDCAPKYEAHPIFAWSQAVLLLSWNFIYGLSLGPLCFVLLCEAPATRLKSKTIAIATAMQGGLGMVMALILPYVFNPDQLNLRGKVGFLFGTLASICLVWAWFRVPEMGDRTYQELDIMFDRKVKTRDFKDYLVLREDDD